MYRNDSTPDDEASLVQRAQRDPEAFGVLYDRYVDLIYRYLLGRTGNVHVAEDLTAETFLAALKGLWRYRFTGKPFSAWLYRIALARVGDYYRRRREVPLDLAVTLPDWRTAHGGLAADYPQLKDAMAQLTATQHEAIVLRYFEDLSVNQIAWLMRCRPNTVKSHLRRGLARLRRILEPPYAITDAKTTTAGGTLAPRGVPR